MRALSPEGKGLRVPPLLLLVVLVLVGRRRVGGIEGGRVGGIEGGREGGREGASGGGREVVLISSVSARLPVPPFFISMKARARRAHFQIQWGGPLFFFNFSFSVSSLSRIEPIVNRHSSVLSIAVYDSFCRSK